LRDKEVVPQKMWWVNQLRDNVRYITRSFIILLHGTGCDAVQTILYGPDNPECIGDSVDE